MWEIVKNYILLNMRIYEFRNIRFDFRTQNIINNQQIFSKIISNMDKDELINICVNGRKTFYTLTDKGRDKAELILKSILGKGLLLYG